MLVCVLVSVCVFFSVLIFFFFQAEDGIRDLVRSRGLGDVYKRQISAIPLAVVVAVARYRLWDLDVLIRRTTSYALLTCLLYTSDAADERSSVDLGGRRLLKKKNTRI